MRINLQRQTSTSSSSFSSGVWSLAEQDPAKVSQGAFLTNWFGATQIVWKTSDGVILPFDLIHILQRFGLFDKSLLFMWCSWEDMLKNLSPWSGLSFYGGDGIVKVDPFTTDPWHRAYEFDGSSNAFLGISDIGYDFLNGITVLAVLIPYGVNAWERIIDLGNGPASDNILFARNNTTKDLTFEVYIGGSSGGSITLGSGLPPDELVVCAAVVNGGSEGDVVSGTVYSCVGGVVTSISDNTAVPRKVTRSSNYIGKSNWSTDAMFKGRMFLVAVWNKKIDNVRYCLKPLYEYFSN